MNPEQISGIIGGTFGAVVGLAGAAIGTLYGLKKLKSFKLALSILLMYILLGMMLLITAIILFGFAKVHLAFQNLALNLGLLAMIQGSWFLTWMLFNRYKEKYYEQYVVSNIIMTGVGVILLTLGICHQTMNLLSTLHGGYINTLTIYGMIALIFGVVGFLSRKHTLKAAITSVP